MTRQMREVRTAPAEEPGAIVSARSSTVWQRVWEACSAANRVQRSLWFKVVASLIVAIAAAAGVGGYALSVAGTGSVPGASAGQAHPVPAAAPSPQEQAIRAAIEASERLVRDILARRSSPANVAIAGAFLAGVAVVVVWLGLGLTYAGLIVGAAAVIWPLRWLGYVGVARLLTGAAVLAACFAALMEAARVALSGGGPVRAIARNVLIEAARIRVAVVFIVVLVFVLAALPLLLDPATPLRYRVQSFLQYGTSGSYGIIALLVLFFAAGTVAFEQRDRQVWQTMTKPVAAWQYVAGKWLGVGVLAGVLMGVCAAGVFAFTEYLRRQPALGERDRIAGPPVLTEDRRILEHEILAARAVVRPGPPVARTDPQFLDWARAFIEEQQRRDPTFAVTETEYDKVMSDLYTSLEQGWRTIPPGEVRRFVIPGLDRARQRGVPLVLRYRVDSGANAPDQLYRITFVINGVLMQPPAEVTLGPSHTLDVPFSLVNDAGELVVEVLNGAMVPAQDPPGSWTIVPNPEAIVFPAKGLEVFYHAGSYQMNFLRVAAVLWVKLVFLGIVAITCATFVSYPVACLVAVTVFLVAEGTGYLATSLEYYHALDLRAGTIVWWKAVVRALGLAVTWMFQTYADLKPTTRLVDGVLLDWQAVGRGVGMIAAWSGALFVAATALFRRRELALYSGR